jgi:hypothetical protein
VLGDMWRDATRAATADEVCGVVAAISTERAVESAIHAEVLRADQVFRACELHYRGEELLGDVVLDEARAILPKARPIVSMLIKMIRGLDT